MTKTNDTSKLIIEDVEAFTRRGGRAMRYAISSSPRMVIIACVGSLLATSPAWSAASWFPAGKLTATSRLNCSVVCWLNGKKTPVTSITNKRTYFVCRAGGIGSGETNRPGYQASIKDYSHSCRVDHKIPPQGDAGFDCLCQ
jgi:hypothetical protein